MAVRTLCPPAFVRALAWRMLDGASRTELNYSLCHPSRCPVSRLCALRGHHCSAVCASCSILQQYVAMFTPSYYFYARLFTCSRNHYLMRRSFTLREVRVTSKSLSETKGRGSGGVFALSTGAPRPTESPLSSGEAASSDVASMSMPVSAPSRYSRPGPPSSHASRSAPLCRGGMNKCWTKVFPPTPELLASLNLCKVPRSGKEALRPQCISLASTRAVCRQGTAPSKACGFSLRFATSRDAAQTRKGIFYPRPRSCWLWLDSRRAAPQSSIFQAG